MKARDWITIVSVIAVIFSWFVNSHLNRKHELFKKRIDYTIEMYESCIETSAMLEKLLQSKSIEKNEKQNLADEFVRHLEKSQLKVFIFGNEREVEQMIKIVQFAQQNKHIEMKNALASLMREVRANFRSMLGITSFGI